MQTYAIGDRISVTIAKIIQPSQPRRKPKILCDLKSAGWTCSLQWNPAVEAQVRLFSVGETIDAWIIRRHSATKFIAVGVSDFGRFPPKADTLAQYVESLHTIRAFLVAAREGNVELPPPEPIAIVKGLFSRSVKKDQWDWLLVYRAFHFDDDGEASKARDSFVRFSEAAKALRRNKIPFKEFVDASRRLLATRCLHFIERAAVSLSAENNEWQATRTPVPVRPPSQLPSPPPSRSIPETETGGSPARGDEDNIIIRSAASLVKTERANALHQLLVSRMSSVLHSKGYDPYCNAFIDLYCEAPPLFFIFEMKSINDSNEIPQIRKALSQLYEYRFLHNFKNAQLVLVLSRQPRQSWVVDYLLSDRGVFVCWLSGNGFACPLAIRNELQNVCDDPTTGTV